MDSTSGDKSLSDKNRDIEDEFVNCIDDKICVDETVIRVGSVKEEPCNMENEQGNIHDYASIKQENIDDLPIVAQETKPMIDRKSKQDIVQNYISIENKNINDPTVIAEETKPIIDCIDNEVCIYETIISGGCIKEELCDTEEESIGIHNNDDIKGSIKEEPCNMENKQGGVYKYVSVKDENIDHLTVIAQGTKLVTDCTDDKEPVIGRGYFKQEPCDRKSDSRSFHQHVNIKDEVIEEQTVVIVQETGLTTNIKENDLIRCEGCGEEYDLYCLKCPMLIRIFNRNSPKHNEIIWTLPKGFIDICKTPNGVGIVALKPIPKGVVFGPFEGLNSIKDDGVSKWKLKNEELAYTKDPKCVNWMQYVRRADQSKLQNLTPIQYRDALYYRSDRHISAGDELLVCWDSGSEENGIRCTGDGYWKPSICERLDDTYACTLCCVGYKSISHLAAHNSRCPEKRNRGDFCTENIQCAFCKIYMDEKEYSDYHMDRCCQSNREKYSAALCSSEDTDKLEVKDKYKCSLCEYSTSEKNKFKTHQLSHTDLRMYKCPECPHRARTDYMLQQHALSHANRRSSRFKCELCGERFTCADFFVLHQKREHSVSIYKCDKCVFETTNAYNLRRHLATHKDVKRYKCKTCGKQYQAKSTLYKHIKHFHKEKKKKYKCSKCAFASFYWANLRDHLLAMHTGVKRFKCHRCAFKTSYKNIIDRHLRYHVNHETSESFEYKRQEGLKPFGCIICPYKAKLKSNLKQHMRTHNNDRPFKCDVCPQTFKENSSLKKHTRDIHSTEKKEVYKCSKCEYSTYRKGDFKQHLARVHENLKPFACTLCSHKATTSSKLKRHMVVHTDDKAFKCDTCSKVFKHKASLSNHLRTIHSDSKKKEYSCPQCPFETKYKRSLKYHMDTHNKSKLFQCSKCEFSTYNQRSFTAHEHWHERSVILIEN